MSDIRINVKAREGWQEARDLKAFLRWVTESTQVDFLMPAVEK
jgi:hypothetical protein